MKYLELYFKWVEIKEIPQSGLCQIFGDDIKLFSPPSWYSHAQEFGDNDWYWGYNGLKPVNERTYERQRRFTPLRQNIVLFLAAMNNEL